MSQIDIIKETIAYLKFWLGVMVISDISLVGWLLSNSGSASDFKLYEAIIGIAIITISALFMHRRIEQLITTLKDL